jgi:hypothetical protein
MSENILNDDESISSGKDKTPNKPKSERKRSEEFALLGLEHPFPKARRRERRPFTEDEDIDLLRGFYMYGPAWSRIRIDPIFKFSERRATDLRDRFRNRYPDKYADAGYKSRPENFPKAPTRTSQKDGLSEPGSALSMSGPAIEPKNERKVFPDSFLYDAPAEKSDPMDFTSRDQTLDWAMNTPPAFSTAGNVSSSFMSHPYWEPPRTTLDPLKLATISNTPSSATNTRSHSPRLAINTKKKPGFVALNDILHASSTSALAPEPEFTTATGTAKNLTLPPPSFGFTPDMDTATADPSFLLSSHFNNSTSSAGQTKRRTAGTESGIGGGSGGAGGIEKRGVELDRMLLWEDMATHPIFDIDGDGSITGGERGGMR